MWATGEAIDGAGDAGATLLEMLVVVALSAMIGGLIFANFRPATDRLTLQLARSELAQTLDSARAKALRTSTSQTVELADDGASYSFAGRRILLPPRVMVRADAAAVVFSANGRTEGDHFRLVRGAHVLKLEVTAGSGVVQMAAAT